MHSNIALFATVVLATLLDCSGSKGLSQPFYPPEKHDFTLRGRSKSISFMLNDYSLERILENMESEEDWNGNDDSANNNNIVWKFFDKVDEDMDEMWQTSPNAWTTEEWEVFGGLFFLAFLALSCLCFLCCAPICLFEDRDERRIMTAEQHLSEEQEKDLKIDMNEENTNRETFKRNQKIVEKFRDEDIEDKFQKSSIDGNLAASSASSRQPNVQQRGSLKEPMLDTLSLSVGSSTLNQASLRSQRSSKKKRRRSIWSEVVSVWSEFLTDLSQGKDTFAKSEYKGYDERDYRRLEEQKKNAAKAARGRSPRKSARHVSSNRSMLV